MSILDSFYFLFEADASSVKKGLKESDDLATKFTANLLGVDAVAKRVGDSFLNAAKSAAKYGTAMLALGTIKQTIENTIDHTFAVNQQSRAMAIAVDVTSTWQHAVVAAGGSSEQAAQSLNNLVVKFRELSAFGGQSFILTQLGLSGKDMQAALKDPTIALLKLSETFGKLDGQQQLYLGNKLGLDMTSISLLSKGRDELEKYLARQRELGVVTAQQAKVAADYKLQMAELGLVYETVRRELTSDFLPALTWLFSKIESLTLFMREHRVASIAFFGGIAAVITAVYLPAVIRATEWTLGLLAPYLLIIAAVAAFGAALAIVTEDVYAFLHDQPSLIGDLSKKWPILGNVVHAVADTIGGAFNLIKEAGKALVTMFVDGPQKAIEQFSGAVDKMMAKLEDRFPKIALLFKVFGEVLKVVFGGLVATVTDLGGILKYLNDRISDLIGGLAKMGSGIWGWIAKKLGWDTTGTPSATSGGLPTVGATKGQNGTRDKAAWAAAQASEKKYGIPAEVTYAQWALESNHGKSMPAGSNNPFGIKARAGQASVDANTTEVINGIPERMSQKFAKYDSLEDAFDAHAKLLATSKTYAAARATHNANDFADALTGKYATDPAYGAKLKSIMAGGMPHDDAIAAGQSQLADANTPVSAMTSNSIMNANKSSSRSLSVKTGDIHVNTAATDGKGTADAMGSALGLHLSSTIDAYDDGIAA